MNNFTTVHSDTKNIYLDSRVKQPLAWKIFLVFFNLAGWTAFFYAMSTLESENVKKAIIPMAFFLTIFIFIIGRFTLWIIYGRESLVISKSSIRHFKSFGLFKTNETVIEINNYWMYGFDRVREENNKEFGNLYFFDHDENDEPFLIYSTDIMVTKETADMLDKKLDDLHHTLITEYIKTKAPLN